MCRARWIGAITTSTITCGCCARPTPRASLGPSPRTTSRPCSKIPISRHSLRRPSRRSGRSSPSRKCRRCENTKTCLILLDGLRSCGFRRSFHEQRLLAHVPRHPCGTLELRACLLVPPELLEQVAAHARQQVIILHRRHRGQLVDDRERLG